MEFKEAYKKLQKMAKGLDGYIHYNSLQFEVGTHSDGTVETRCSLYIAEYPWTKIHRTWKEAFAQMEEMVNPQPKKNEEIPKISDHEDFAQEKRTG